MFKIHFWGTSAGAPEPDKRFSCIHIQRDDLQFMLDCGEGASHAYTEYIKDVNLLDFVFITHTHADHAGGIFQLIQLFQMKKRKKPLVIFCPEDVERFRAVLELFYILPEALPYELILYPCSEVTRHYPFITPFVTDHLTRFIGLNHDNTCQSWGINIGYKDQKIVYTSDIVSIHSVRDYVKDSHICIVDAIHPPVSEFMELEKVVAGVVYLTHGMTPELEEYIEGKDKYSQATDGFTFELAGDRIG